jgi:hypothetical protein
MKKSLWARSMTLLGALVAVCLVLAPPIAVAGHLDGTGGFRFTIDGEGGSSSVAENTGGNGGTLDNQKAPQMTPGTSLESSWSVCVVISFSFVRYYLATIGIVHNR